MRGNRRFSHFNLHARYSQGYNIFDIYPKHFAFFAVHDFGHRKECKVRKDSLNCLVVDYKQQYLNQYVSLSKIRFQVLSGFL